MNLYLLECFMLCFYANAIFNAGSTRRSNGVNEEEEKKIHNLSHIHRGSRKRRKPHHCAHTMNTIYGLLFILFATNAALTESKGDNISFLRLLLLQSDFVSFFFFQFFYFWMSKSCTINESKTKKVKSCAQCCDSAARLWPMVAWRLDYPMISNELKKW